MTNNSIASVSPKPPSKHMQVTCLLSRNEGATLEEMSVLANWLPHSTRAFMTGLRKKGHNVTSDKTDGVRRYRIVPPVSQ